MNDSVQIVFTILFRSNEMPPVNDTKLLESILQKYKRLDFIVAGPNKKSVESFNAFILSLIQSDSIDIPYGLIVPSLNHTKEKTPDQPQSILDLLNSIFQYDIAPWLDDEKKRNIIVLMFVTQTQAREIINELSESRDPQNTIETKTYDQVDVLYELDEPESCEITSTYNA